MNKELIITNLSKTYNTIKGEIKAINNINLEVNKGEIFGIIGPSGCGKSTLLNIISKLEKETNGHIETNNKVISYMLQNDCLLPWLTIKENALIGLKLRKQLTKENILYVENLINKFGLKEFSNNYPSSLSGGMKQRVPCFIKKLR